MTSKCGRLVLVFVASYCQINVCFRQELALSDDSADSRLPRARENQLD
jgi:hypothetical protein